jgi:hypothetical protein
VSGKFLVFIDESGEAGIAKVRDGLSPGASPFFVLAAVAVQPAGLILARKTVAEFRASIGKKTWKHATELDHTQKVLFCRMISSLPLRCFGLISKKETLQEYRAQIDNDPQQYYNKCLKYLLERVFSYLGPRIARPEDVSITLEERNHDYDRMLRYLTKVKDNPIYHESRVLASLNPFSITRAKKGEEAALEVADLVAHALFQCVNKSKANFGIPEYRYFEEIESRFAANEAGMVLGTGLKCIHSLGALGLDEVIAKKFSDARAVPPKGRDR